MIKNRRAIRAVYRRAALVQAAGAVTLLPVLVYDDAAAIRSSLVKAFAAEISVSSSDVATVLNELRGHIYADLTARMKNAVASTTITPPEVLPAYVVAYDLYEDAARADEIVARNKIAHPGFVPPQPLRVLVQ